MKKNIIILTTALLAALTWGAGSAFAQASGYPEGELIIDGKKPARFSHQSHAALGMDCAVCHHDSENKPLTAEMIGALPDTKQLQCVSCHNDSFANSELQNAKDVFHARCLTCHKDGYEGKQGPAKCTDCHVKAKKGYEGC
jgi:hypothetical protein